MINKVSQTIKENIRRKSVLTSPDNPSAVGETPLQIKQRIAGPVLDPTNSALSEIDRVVGEVNQELQVLQTENTANDTNLTEHIQNLTPHILDSDRTNWNDANFKKHEHTNKTVLDDITASYTTSEKAKLSGIASGAQVNPTIASKAEAETGADNTAMMTPLRTKEAIAGQAQLKEAGKGLSTEDYTTTEKEKLAGITLGAQPNIIEKIQANGIDLIITEKKVNITKEALGAGVVNGLAELDGTGKVKSSQLPTGVATIEEYTDLNSFPTTGVTGVTYVDSSNSKQYLWSGTQYVEITPGLALGETSSTAYRGDWGKEAYDHSKTSGNPHGTTISNISGLQDFIDNKVDKISGKGLSTEDYTATEKTKLASIATGAQVNPSISTQAEAEAGEENTKIMTALRVKQAVTAQAQLKETGKGLSTNDYTTSEKNKLAGIAVGAEVNVQSDWNTTDTGVDSYIKNKPTSMPASDVSSWAKQPIKPTYTYSEVGAEAAFTKNTAFNKNFGTIAGTVCQGNDSRLSDTRDPKSHGLLEHAAAGLTTGHFLKATGSGTYAFQAHGLTASNVGAVPTSRKVNNKALSSDVVITEGDIIPQVTAITSTLEAGKSYFFSPSAALNIAILTSAPTGLSHWHFVVRMTTAVNITWGSLDIKWNSDLPTYAVNKTYEFSIIKCGSYYYGAWTSYTN